MGLTHIEVVVASPGHPRKAARLRFLVDSGAVYSVVPGSVLRHLGIKPRMHDSMRTIRLIVAAVFAVPLLGLTLSKPRARSRATTAPERGRMPRDGSAYRSRVAAFRCDLSSAGQERRTSPEQLVE